MTLITSGCTGVDDAVVDAINSTSTLVNAAIVDTVTDPSVDTTAPSAPSNLRLTSNGLSASYVELIWNASSDNVGISHYELIRGNTVLSTSIQTTGYIDSTVIPDMNYSYIVKAVDLSGNFSISNSIPVTTPSPASSQPEVDTTAPSVPSNLRLASNSPTTSSITLNWNASSDNVGITGYRILRNSTVIATTSASTTSYSNTGLDSDTLYQYQVEAFDAADNTAITNALAVSTLEDIDSTSPSAPGNLAETSKTNTLAAFSWSASIDNVAVTGYRIFRDTQLITTLSAATTSYTNVGLSASTTYQFQVEAFDAAGNTARTNNLSMTTLVAPSISCTSTINPGQSFSSAFSTLQAGDTLCLNDGTYNQAMDIPSNINVRAVNDGMAEIDGLGQYGEEWSGGLVQMKGTNSSVRGLRVHHASTNAHACYMSGSNNTMQVMSCSHAGMQKHKNPIFMTGSGHLLEESWAFGKGRYVVQCFKGSNMTLRHNVARWDITTDNTPTEPNAGFSIYNCNDVTVENNISLDYGLSSQEMRHGADFYAPHNAGEWANNNNNHYLGNYAINHALGNLNRNGMRFDAAGAAVAENNVIKDFYVNKSNNGVIIPSYITDLEMDNCTFLNIDMSNIVGGSQNNVGVCNGTSSFGAVYVDRAKVSNNLFPWKNEALIKADMCRSGERQSDWCATNLTLSEYIASL